MFEYVRNRITPPLYHCHDYTRGSSLFLSKTKYLNFQSFKVEQRVLLRNIHDAHIVLTLSRLLGVDDPWSRQKLGISVLIYTGPAAKLLSWLWHYGCHFVSFLIYISCGKFEEQRSNISRDILYSVFCCCSGTIYDVIHIPKRKMPFFILKSLSNKQQLFFYFIGTLKAA